MGAGVMSVLEDQVERTVLKIAKNRGWYMRKVKWVGVNGAPDRFFAKAGETPFWIEFKAPGEKPRQDQIDEISKMREAGLTVHVIDSIEEGAALFGVC